jgi:hypothetical protein
MGWLERLLSRKTDDAPRVTGRDLDDALEQAQAHPDRAQQIAKDLCERMLRYKLVCARCGLPNGASSDSGDAEGAAYLGSLSPCTKCGSREMRWVKT